MRPAKSARELPLEDFPAHFERLERIAIGLGDMSASNNQILKLAFYFWTRDVSAYTNEELESNLSDALRLPPADNQLLENFLIRMLTEADRRGLHPTDEGDLPYGNDLLFYYTTSGASLHWNRTVYPTICHPHRLWGWMPGGFGSRREGP